MMNLIAFKLLSLRLNKWHSGCIRKKENVINEYLTASKILFLRLCFSYVFAQNVPVLFVHIKQTSPDAESIETNFAQQHFLQIKISHLYESAVTNCFYTKTSWLCFSLTFKKKKKCFSIFFFFSFGENRIYRYRCCSKSLFFGFNLWSKALFRFLSIYTVEVAHELRTKKFIIEAYKLIWARRNNICFMLEYTATELLHRRFRFGTSRKGKTVCNQHFHKSVGMILMKVCK